MKIRHGKRVDNPTASASSLWLQNIFVWYEPFNKRRHGKRLKKPNSF
jgi:hypothetical protein